MNPNHAPQPYYEGDDGQQFAGEDPYAYGYGESAFPPLESVSYTSPQVEDMHAADTNPRGIPMVLPEAGYQQPMTPAEFHQSLGEVSQDTKVNFMQKAKGFLGKFMKKSGAIELDDGTEATGEPMVGFGYDTESAGTEQESHEDDSSFGFSYEDASGNTVSNPFNYQPTSFIDTALEPQPAWISPSAVSEAANAYYDLAPAAPADPSEASIVTVRKPEDDAVLPPIAEIKQDLHIRLTAEELKDPAKVAETFEAQRYIKVAPGFHEIINDETRTNEFTYNPKRDDGRMVTMTEHEGAVGLDNFLEKVTEGYQGMEAYEGRRDFLKSIRENLTFIGEKEYSEAVAGIGSMWKDYLREHPDNTLCVPTEITKKEGEGARKSDIYLFERIMDSFSDEELEEFNGKILTSVHDLESDPDHTRIVLLDDWTISGAQITSAYREIMENSNSSKYRNSVEVDLIATTEDRIENGLPVTKWQWINGARQDQNGMLPVKSYYKAHHAEASEYGAHITGTHSAVDYDFELKVSDAVNQINYAMYEKYGVKKELEMPPLTHIKRTYRNGQPLVTVNSDGSVTRNEKKV